MNETEVNKKEKKFTYKTLTNGKKFKLEKFRYVVKNNHFGLLYNQDNGKTIKVEWRESETTYDEIKNHQVAEILSRVKDEDVEDIDLYNEILKGFVDIDSENYARIANSSEIRQDVVLAHARAAEIHHHSYEILRILSMEDSEDEKIKKIDTALYLIIERIKEIKIIFNLK